MLVGLGTGDVHREMDEAFGLESKPPKLTPVQKEKVKFINWLSNLKCEGMDLKWLHIILKGDDIFLKVNDIESNRPISREQVRGLAEVLGFKLIEDRRYV